MREGRSIGLKEGRELGRKVGHEEGYAEGYGSGRQSAIGRAAGIGTVSGAAIGLVLALGLVMLLTWRRWWPGVEALATASALRREAVAGDVPLSLALAQQVIAAGARRRELERVLAQDRRPAVQAFRAQLLPQLSTLGSRVAAVATTLQRLRELPGELVNSEPNILWQLGEYRRRLERADSGGRENLMIAINTEERKLYHLRQIRELIARCELKLATHVAFLDDLHLTLASVGARGDDQSMGQLEAAMGEEVASLEQTLEEAWAELRATSS